MQDRYISLNLLALKKAKSRADKELILNKLYEEGFEDGANSQYENTISHQPKMKGAKR